MKFRKDMTIRVCLLWVAFGCFIIGCNSDGKVPVSGTVTWNGEPISEGHIILQPTNRSLAPDADKIVDGSFAFRASPGEKQVQIFADRYKGEVVEVMGLAEKEQYIPVRYNEETELTVNVEARGENSYDLDLVEQKGDVAAGSKASKSAR